MPNYSQPKSDAARVAFLTTASAAAQNDYAQGNKYILQETFDSLRRFAPQFENRATVINQKLSARSKEIGEGNSALNSLATFVRDGFEVVKRQVSRLNLPAHVLALYGLPLDGTVPKPTTAVEWLAIGRTFVQGGAQAVVQGHPPIACPTLDEIREKLAQAEKERADVSKADREYDKAQADMAEARGSSICRVKRPTLTMPTPSCRSRKLHEVTTKGAARDARRFCLIMEARDSGVLVKLVKPWKAP